jgi:hypothetical protein
VFAGLAHWNTFLQSALQRPILTANFDCIQAGSNLDYRQMADSQGIWADHHMPGKGVVGLVTGEFEGAVGQGLEI